MISNNPSEERNRLTSTRQNAFIAVACALLALLIGAAIADPVGARLALPIALGFLLVAVAGRRPEAAVLGLVVARPIVDCFVQIQTFGFSLGQLWGGALVFCCAIYLLAPDSRERGVTPPIPWPPLVFLIAYPFLTVSHGDVALVLGGTVKLASWILLALVVERVCATPQGQALTLRAVMLTAVSVVVAIAIVISQNRYGASYYDSASRLDATTQGPHQFAFMAVVAVFFMLATVLIRRDSFLPAMLAAVLCGELVLSFVRTVYVGVLPILVVFLYLATRRLRARAIAVFLLLAVVASVAVYYSEGAILPRLQNLAFFGSSATPTSSLGSGRIAIWGATLSSSFSTWTHALFGQGVGASRDVIRQAIGVSVWAHSDLIELLLAGGILLVGAFATLIAWLFISTWRLAVDDRQSRLVRRWAILAVSCIVGYFLMSLTNGVVFYQASVLMAVLIGLCRGMYLTPGQTVLDRISTRSSHELRTAPAATPDNRPASRSI